MMEKRDDFSYLNSTEDECKGFGIKVDKIDMGLSFGVCISYDKYAKECYLFINLIKWSVSIGWLSFERKENEQKAIDDEATLKGFTTDELRVELKRRAAEEKAKKESVLRCRMCKHWGAIDYWGEPTNYSVGDNRSCKFFKTKNGKYYRCHSASQLACENFERREE